MTDATHNTTPTPPESRPALALAHGSATYNHEWNITVRADSLQGAMDAVWKCWQEWQSGAEPFSGCCPESMGERMMYHVKKVKSPNAEVSDSRRG